MKISLFFLFIAFGIQAQEGKTTDYKLMQDDDGILVEQFDPAYTDENRFTDNNEIFREGRKFFYDFRHISKEGENFYFTFIDSLRNWKYVPASEKSDKLIKEVVIEVQPGLQPFLDHDPDYNQSIISFNYPMEIGYSQFRSTSGVIENEANIWMHPPRDQYFRILELNPFPYIKAPYEIGTRWTWKLQIGEYWGDPRWKTWEGSILNEYLYEITDKRMIETKLGKIECYVIGSIAKSRIGESTLTSFFNEKYGYVLLEYANIDGSKTILELREVVEPQIN